MNSSFVLVNGAGAVNARTTPFVEFAVDTAIKAAGFVKCAKNYKLQSMAFFLSNWARSVGYPSYY